MVAAHIASAKASFCFTISAFASFLRKPCSIVDPYGDTKSKSAAFLWLYILSMLFTAGFGILASPWLLTSTAAPGDNLRDVLDRPIASVIVTMILIGPVIEEMLFRGWLTGTWRAMGGSVACLAIVFGGAVLLEGSLDGFGWAKQIGLTISGLATAYVLMRVSGRVALKGYEQLFPYIFWGQGIVFGALHLRNVIAEPVVVPLLSAMSLALCGWLWGYARITLGLKAAIVLHVAYNIPAVLGTMALVQLRSS